MRCIGAGHDRARLPLDRVNQLDATNGQISIIMTVFFGAMVLSSTMRRLVEIGRERVLTIGTFGYALNSAADFRLAVGLVAVALALLAGVLNARVAW